MKRKIHDSPSIEKDGWTLVSGEARQYLNPETFQIPTKKKRQSLMVGDAAKLLFDIEIREQGKIADRGVDRMWVIVKSIADGGFVGILDSDPGIVEGLNLHQGDLIRFGPEHIIEIDRPSNEYLLKILGKRFSQ